MGQKYPSYVADCIKTAAYCWQRHEGVTVLVGAFLALVAAFLAVLGFQVQFDENAGLRWAALLGLWFVFLFIFVAPYLVWKRDRRTIDGLENERKAKLEVSVEIDEITGQRRMGTSGYLVVKNTSASQPVTDVQVQIESLDGAVDGMQRAVRGLLLFDESNAGRETINPRAGKRLVLVKINQLISGMREEEPIRIGPFATGEHPELKTWGPYVMVLSISGSNSPAMKQRLSLGRDQDGRLFLCMMPDDGDVTAAIHDPIGSEVGPWPAANT